MGIDFSLDIRQTTLEYVSDDASVMQDVWTQAYVKFPDDWCTWSHESDYRFTLARIKTMIPENAQELFEKFLKVKTFECFLSEPIYDLIPVGTDDAGFSLFEIVGTTEKPPKPNDFDLLRFITMQRIREHTFPV